MSDARAIGYLELNISGFQEAITTAKRALATLAVGFTAFKGIKLLESATADAIKFGDALYHASQAAGRFKPETFFLIQKALQNAGLGADEARGKITEFVQNGRRVQDLFGGQAQYGAALQNAAKEYGAEAKVFGQNAAVFSKVFETLQSVGEKVRTFFAQVAVQFLKPLQVLLETLQRVDLSGTAQKFGKYIADALTLLNGFIANGGFGTALGLSVKIAFKEGLNYFAGGMLTVLKVFAEGLLRVFLNSNMWAGVTNIMVGIAGAFGAALLKAVEKPLSAAQGLLTGGLQALHDAHGDPVAAAVLAYTLGKKGAGPVADAMAESQKNGLSWGTLGNTPNKAAKEGLDLASAGAAQLANALPELKTIFQNLGKELADIKSAGLFSAGEDEARLKDILSRAFATGQELADKAKSKLPDVLSSSTGAVSPYSVIADSLARVGGGGGFLRTGQSIQAKATMDNTRATEENTRASNALDATLRQIQGNLSPAGNQRGAAHFNEVLSNTLMLS